MQLSPLQKDMVACLFGATDWLEFKYMCYASPKWIDFNTFITTVWPEDEPGSIDSSIRMLKLKLNKKLNLCGLHVFSKDYNLLISKYDIREDYRIVIENTKFY